MIVTSIFFFTIWIDCLSSPCFCHAQGLCAILSRLFWTGADTQSSALSPLYIVHCSAGIGRTGSFLLAWTALEDMFAKQVAEIPDFADLLVKLRRHRGGLVQGSEQFMFSFQLACDALGESIVR